MWDEEERNRRAFSAYEHFKFLAFWAALIAIILGTWIVAELWAAGKL